MSNLFNLSEEEKNRIRGLHITESKDSRISSVLVEQNEESLAKQFYAATKGQWGTDEEAVYQILDQLKTTEDFNTFNEELEGLEDNTTGDFYDIACDGTLWIREIGGKDEIINDHLIRLGVKPIKCYIMGQPD